MFPSNQMAIDELESAARTFLASPTVVTCEQRHAAEQVFLRLQKTKQPFDFCKMLLEESQVPYVQFQGATLLKNTSVREWKNLSLEQTVSLRNYILSFLTSRASLESYVREQMVLALAIIIKRQYADADDSVISLMLNELSQLIMSDNNHMQVVGCSVLAALLNEFASSTRASDVGLPWEVHMRVKKQFETSHLLRIFEFCLHGLTQASSLQPPLPKDALHLLRNFLSLAEKILLWNFQFCRVLPRMLVNILETEAPSFRPGCEWRNTFLQEQVPALFFRLYDHFCEDPSLAHHIVQCITQLCTINDRLFTVEAEHRAYVRWIFAGLVEIIGRLPIKAHLVVGISNALLKLVKNQPSAILVVYFTEDLFYLFITRITAFTCHLIEMATQEEAASVDDEVYTESLETIFCKWTTICQDHVLGRLNWSDSILQIFTVYLRSHLAPPDGIKPQQPDNNEITDDSEEDDRTKFKNQLTVIGMMGRRVLQESVFMLSQLLEARTLSLQQLLERNMTTSPQFVQVSEDIHWLLLISGHLLSTGPLTGEVSSIPASIAKFCRSTLRTPADAEVTLRALSQPSQLITDARVHPLVRLILAVFRLLEMETQALEAGLRCSPEVGRTLVWFLWQWGSIYMFSLHFYYPSSLVLYKCFSCDSEAGQWLFFERMVPKLRSNLLRWSGEPVLLIETCQCLSTLFVSWLDKLNDKSSPRSAESSMARVRKYLPLFIELVQLEATDSVRLYLPFEAKRSLVKALVLGGSALFYFNDRLPVTGDVTTSPDDDDLTSGGLIADSSGSNCSDDGNGAQPLSSSSTTLTPAADAALKAAVREQRQKFFDQLLCPLQKGLEQLLSNANGIAGCGQSALLQEPARRNVLDILERLTGAIHGVHISNAEWLGDYILPVLPFVATLVEVCHNYQDVVSSCIQVYLAVALGLIAHFRKSEAASRVYAGVLSMMKSYSKHQSGKLTIDPSAEETQYQDLLDLVQLLGEILFKDLMLFGANDNEDGDSSGNMQQPRLTVSDVAFHGLNFLMPVMTPELFRFPTLCSKYFSFVNLVGELYRSKVFELPGNLLVSIFKTIRLGMTEYTSDVASSSIDFIGGTASSVVQMGSKTPQIIHQLLQPFLQLVVEMCLLQPLEADLTAKAGRALFPLMCCYPDSFRELAERMVAAQVDEIVRQRLADAFFRLTEGISLVLARENRVKFRAAFDPFVTQIRGILCVK